MSGLARWLWSCQALRGVTCQVAVIDEAGFARESMVKNVIYPLLGVKDTALLATSTPSADGMQNYYSRLFTLKNDDGTPVFQRHQIGLACQSCRRLGRPEDCEHNLSFQPTWKSADGGRMRRIMGSETFQREQQGLMPDAKKPAFIPSYLDLLERQTDYAYGGRANLVFVAVDPAGGSSKSSELSLMLGTFNRDGALIVSSRCRRSVVARRVLEVGREQVFRHFREFVAFALAFEWMHPSAIGVAGDEQRIVIAFEADWIAFSPEVVDQPRQHGNQRMKDESAFALTARLRRFFDRITDHRSHGWMRDGQLHPAHAHEITRQLFVFLGIGTGVEQPLMQHVFGWSDALLFGMHPRGTQTFDHVVGCLRLLLDIGHCSFVRCGPMHACVNAAG